MPVKVLEMIFNDLWFDAEAPSRINSEMIHNQIIQDMGPGTRDIGTQPGTQLIGDLGYGTWVLVPDLDIGLIQTVR